MLKLTHVRLLVNKLDECRHFYKDVLGFKEEVEVPGIYFEFLAGNCRLAVYKRDLMANVVGSGEHTSGDQVAITFEVANVDEAFEELRAKGVEFVREPHDQEAWVLRAAHLRDPEGTLIEINAPLRK
jgi:lactoylglutathione lyase